MMFQDVIMAVFGVLILIVIYLLINAKVSDIEFVAALEEMREEKTALGESIKAAEVEREALYENAVRDIRGRETIELSKQVEANRLQIERFDSELHSLLAEAEAKSEELGKTISERFENHPGVLNTRREIDEKRAEVEDLKRSIARAEAEAKKTARIIATTESYMDEIKNQFRVELDDSLAGESVYLVDLSGRQARAFKVYQGVQRRVEATSTQELLRQVKSDPAKKRVFFFVRPDAVYAFNEALVAFRESNIAVGYQPVPAGEKLILTKFPDGTPAVSGANTQDNGNTTNRQARSGEVGGADSSGGGSIASGGAVGGESDSEAQSDSQTIASETAASSGGGSTTSSGDGQVQPPEDVDLPDEGTLGPDQAGQEASSEDAKSFNWLILVFLLLFLIILTLTIKGSKK